MAIQESGKNESERTSCYVKNIAHYAFDVKVNNGSISNNNYEWIHFKKFQAFRIWIQN